MKISFCGTSSVGKSTLAKCVSERTGIPLLLDKALHERTFEVMKKQGRPVSTTYFPGMSREEHVDFERHVFLTRAEMERELGEHYITDESPVDFINWYYIICGPHPELMAADEFRFFKYAWSEQIARYKHIWYLPVGVLPVENDNRRFTNTVSLEFWDNAIRGLLQKMQPEIGDRLKHMPAEKIKLEDRADLVVGEMELAGWIIS